MSVPSTEKRSLMVGSGSLLQVYVAEQQSKPARRHRQESRKRARRHRDCTGYRSKCAVGAPRAEKEPWMFAVIPARRRSNGY